MFISRVENASLCPYKSNITVPMAIAPGSMDVMLSLLLLDGHIVNVHVHVYVHVKDSGFDYLAFNLKTKLITLPCQKCVVVVQRASAKCNVNSGKCMCKREDKYYYYYYYCVCVCVCCVCVRKKRVGWARNNTLC